MINKVRALHGQLDELRLPIHGRRKSLKERNRPSVMNEPIDIVVTWVDGNDPQWKAEKAKYASIAGIESNISARFREWGTFVYWFRMIEKYAPWVNIVWLVTWGHVPSWINRECSKLKIISHKEFIPEQYLPTFNSIPIELNIWRIKDLSEHFIYMNDDMFLTKPVSPSDFFDNGVPKYEVIAEPLKNYGDYAYFQHQLFSNLGMINKQFNLRQCIEKCPEKWFSYSLGEDIKYNIMAYQCGFLPGMRFTHLGCPYRKSTFEKVWDEMYDRLDWTCLHKFRDPLDAMHQVVQLWDICEGNFVPVPRGYYGRAPVDMSTAAIDQAVNEENIFVCLNDSEKISEDEFVEIQSYCQAKLKQKYPDKSCYEIDAHNELQ